MASLETCPLRYYPEEESVLLGDYDELLNASVIKRSERWRKHNWFIKQCKTANWDEMDEPDKELFLLTILDMNLLYTQAILDADAAGHNNTGSDDFSVSTDSSTGGGSTAVNRSSTGSGSSTSGSGNN